MNYKKGSGINERGGKRKCSKCGGKGFTFDGRKYTTSGMFGIVMTHEKEPCKGCHGRGVR